jgi:type IV secretory pathway ATPase VirB11/archaellum biosynthesis ATPase
MRLTIQLKSSILTQVLGTSQKTKPQTITKSSLFTVTGVPVAGFVDETRVNLFGLETRVFVTEMKTVYVFDEVELPEQLPDDRTIGRILSSAEKEYSRKEIDPYGVLGTEDERRYNIKVAIEILERKIPKRWKEHALALARLLWRWYYAYGAITPFFLAEGLGITDVMLTMADKTVTVDTYKHGAGLVTNIELTPKDREHVQDAISRRVAPLSAARPFTSRFDDLFRVRVTAIVPDVAPTQGYAFRLINVVWTAPFFTAMGGAEPWQMAYLCAQWRRGRHTLVAGLPGSGKTSLLNAVLSCTQTTRRLAIIQSVPELFVPQAAFIAIERISFGAGISDILMAELVQRFGLRANSDVGINELLTESDVRAFVTIAFAGFGAGATIHAQSAEEVVLRLLRLGVTQAELEALMPRLIIPVMEKAVTPRGVVRRISKIYVPTPQGHRPIAREEALKDPEAARWEQIIAEAAGMKMLHSPEAWVAYLKKFD